MSDSIQGGTPPRPKPKPGSLRDRIAAFEKPSQSSESVSPPPPRPKPGGVQWRPKVQQQQQEEDSSNGASGGTGVGSGTGSGSGSGTGEGAAGTGGTASKVSGGSMSASDARESIRQGASLKERMAALQGRGAFGGLGGGPIPVQPPVQPVQRPKWKPPPQPQAVSVSSVADGEEEREEKEKEKEEGDNNTAAQGGSATGAGEDKPEAGTSGLVEAGEEGAEQEQEQEPQPDPEEEERQRRAAIAARMARLGGARVGMAPSAMFGTKPPPPPIAKKPTLPVPAARPKDESEDVVEAVTSPPLSEPAELAAVATSTEIVEARAGAGSDLSPSSPPPSHSRSPPPPFMPVPAVPRRAAPPRRKLPKSPVPTEAEPSEATQANDQAEAEAETKVVLETVKQVQDVLGDMEPLTKEERREVEIPPVEEVETMQSLEKDKVVRGEEGEPVKDMAEIVEEPDSQEQEREKQEQEQEQEQEREQGQEQEQEARRKRIAERLTKMGGVNPLFAPPPPRRMSTGEKEATSPRSSIGGPFRRSSVDSVGLIKSGGIPEQDERSEVISESVTVSKGLDEIMETGKAKLGEDQESVTNLASTHGSQGRWDEAENLEGSNDALAASMILEGLPLPSHKDEEPEYATSPPALDKSTRPAAVSDGPNQDEQKRSSGFVTKPTQSDDEREHEAADGQGAIGYEQEQEQEGHQNREENGNQGIPEEPSRASPPPLPISPRTASFVPSSLVRRFGPKDQDEDEDGDEDEEEPRPLPIPHRTSSSASSRPPLRIAADDDRYNEVEEVKHLPSPPTRRVPSPPPSESLAQAGPAMGPKPPISSNQELSSHTAIVEDETGPEQTEEHEEGTGQGQEPERQDPEPSSGLSDAPLVIPPPAVERRLSKDDMTIRGPLSHRIPVRRSEEQVRQTSPVTGMAARDQREVMDDDEGDPIDPSIHVSMRASMTTTGRSRGHVLPQDGGKEEKQEAVDLNAVDMEAARRRTIAERMAKLGGIKFGAAPPMPQARLPVVPSESISRAEELATEEGNEKVEDEEGEEEKKEADEEEEERARKERIAAKLAGMGGMRIGMMPPMMGIPPRPPQRPAPPPTVSPVSVKEEATPAPPSPTTTTRGPPRRPPPLPQSQDVEWERGSTTTSEDGVKVEMEESDMEEVNHEDARMDDEYEDGEMVAHPLPPTRVLSTLSSPTQRTRPPVPSTMNVRRLSSGTIASSTVPLGRKGSSGSTVSTILHRTKAQPDYVMVEEPQSVVEEDVSSSPPYRSIRRRSTREAPPYPPPPPPPSATQSMSDSISSQWELPTIPSGGFSLGTTGFGGTDLSLSWMEAEDTSQGPHAQISPPIVVSPTTNAVHSLAVSPTLPADQQQRISSEELTAIWGRVGVQICEIAVALYEKSKRTLVGDGTYAGFVHAVLSEVPNAVRPTYAVPSAASGLVTGGQWGYSIYAQNGPAVQRRLSDIMPGDIAEFVDARFKGHKGLQTYSQHVGATGEALVGVVTEVEQKKLKVRMLQANQHVGQQAVESASYRLEDLKSGTIKVYRVLEAQ